MEWNSPYFLMPVSALIIAWFLILMIPGQDYPVLKGPYLARQDCEEVRKYYEKQGRITGGCSMMTVPQETAVPMPDDEGEPYTEVKPEKQLRKL